MSTRVSAATPATFVAVLMYASRWPSVVTIVIESGSNINSAPLSVYRDSSWEMAKIVRRIIVRTASLGRVIAEAAGNSGRLGKFLRGKPTIFVCDRPLRICTQALGRDLIV